jgi:nucleoside 2-deoxyribosyltransferase
MAQKLKIYMAGPDVFLPNEPEIRAAKKQLLSDYGFEGLYPLDNDFDPTGLTDDEFARVIKIGNCAMMRRADGMIANLTPFHGPSPDSGTVFELGFMDALDKPIFGYMNVDEKYVDRVRAYCGGTLIKDKLGRLRDQYNMEAENLGLYQNLMIEKAVQCMPTRHMAVMATTETERYTSLTAYEQAVRLMARELLGAQVKVDPAIVRAPTAL